PRLPRQAQRRVGFGHSRGNNQHGDRDRGAADGFRKHPFRARRAHAQRNRGTCDFRGLQPDRPKVRPPKEGLEPRDASVRVRRHPHEAAANSCRRHALTTTSGMREGVGGPLAGGGTHGESIPEDRPERSVPTAPRTRRLAAELLASSEPAVPPFSGTPPSSKAVIHIASNDATDAPGLPRAPGLPSEPVVSTPPVG